MGKRAGNQLEKQFGQINRQVGNGLKREMNRQRRRGLKSGKSIAIFAICAILLFASKFAGNLFHSNIRFGGGKEYQLSEQPSELQHVQIPQYDGKDYIEINENVPFFGEQDLSTEPFEYYSRLDSLGRCGSAYANVCRELMPKERREEIGQVRPSGWHTVKYDGIDGLYLYNRSHLIGFQLTGENANEENLITGTRYFNARIMLPFEEAVAEYVKETRNHVLYRVTPIFRGENLVADGVLMEAYSVEDKGSGIMFNVFCYNIQPGIEIDYATGESRLAKD